MSRSYFKEIDVIKGIAILMVIMAHGFCHSPIDIAGSLPLAFQDSLIYVQMPLFFLASGFLFQIKEDWGDFFRKKLFRIAVPYFVFSIFSILLRIIAGPYTNSGVPNWLSSFIALLTGGYYWFLYSLLLMMGICKLLTKELSHMLLLIFIFATILFFDDYLPVILYRTFHYLPFFILGIYVRRSYEHIQNLAQSKWGGNFVHYSCMLLFILCIFE